MTEMKDPLTPKIIFKEWKRNSKSNNNQIKNQNNNYNKTRYVVERFFAWLKNGFHRIRIRYKRIADNYLAFVNIASIMMYWRVLG